MAKELGAEHPDVTQSLDNLGEAYIAQGRYAEAEPLKNRSLEIREKVLGPNHLDVATSINNLANLYEYQGRYREAESHFKQYTLRIAMCPPSLSNLARLYQAQGRLNEAEPLFKRALEIRQKTLPLRQTPAI